MIKLSDLKIDPELRALSPPLSEEEYNSISLSLSTHGWWKGYKIIYDAKSKIVADGMNRFELCQILNIIPEIEERKFASRLELEQFVIENNLARRNLSTLQKAQLALKLLPIEAEMAKTRKLSKLKHGDKSPIASSDADGEKGKALALIAKRYGLSTATLERCKTIIDSKDEELIKRVNAGKTSISFGAKSVKRKTRKTRTPDLPTDKFNIVICDVPLKYDNNARGSSQDHYDAKTPEELINFMDEKGKMITDVFADDCMLFFWATAPRIQDALAIISEWGFEYKTQIVWVKVDEDKLVADQVPSKDAVQLGGGYYVRNSHEILFICKRGNIPLPNDEDKPKSVVFAERTTHSKKPEVFYDIIEKLYPNQKYLELFARNTRMNWMSWGNEV